MSPTIERTSLWKNTLDKNSSYAHNFPSEVEKLRTNFNETRQKAKVVAEYIKASQPGLTLHDNSHLDALWETAETIGGTQLKLNPIEAYVFGCSILFHDLGMALVLWDEQLARIKSSFEYKDLVYTLLKESLKKPPSKEEIEKCSSVITNKAISTRLRELHAFKAEELPMKYFNLHAQVVYLIESSDLRMKLGRKIGLIAKSHWMNLEELQHEFKENISPAPTSFPPDWTINNIKLATLLRLADYIHIDDRRAPLLEYALEKPNGLSNDHWSFQNKLNRARSNSDRLIFESHTPFSHEDAKAWWLAYETIKDIDKELKVIDELLMENSIERFQCKGVRGIESPLLFSSFVKTSDWEPVDTQLKISDFKNLIEKFGGEQLYGRNLVVPIRELIQNASDAVLAKKFYKPDFTGSVEISYSKDDDINEYLVVEDNGIGMSKSGLLYGLLDFGKSYWKSNLMLKEHAGLLSSGFRPTGNFGIGFFSVFMIADSIQIITKTISANGTIVLEFLDGILTNPILRMAKKEEERIESGTRLRLKLKIKDIIPKIYKQLSHNEREDRNSLDFICRYVAPALPVNLYTNISGIPKKQIINGDDWKTIDSLILLKRVMGLEPDGNSDFYENQLAYISEFVRPVFDSVTNEIIARATVVKRIPSNNSYSGYGAVTVGGILHDKIYRFPGLWMGKTDILSRNKAEIICKYPDLLNWLKEQYLLVIKSNKLVLNEKIELAEVFCSFGLQCKALPIARTSSGWKTYDELVSMEHGDHVLLRFVLPMDNEAFKIIGSVICAKFSVKNITLDSHSKWDTSSLWDDESTKGSNNPADNKFFSGRSMIGFTIKAICESWGVTEKEAHAESLLSLTKWMPIMAVYEDNYGDLEKLPVLVLANPRKIKRKEIYKRYQNEIKKYIGMPDDAQFPMDLD